MKILYTGQVAQYFSIPNGAEAPRWMIQLGEWEPDSVHEVPDNAAFRFLVRPDCSEYIEPKKGRKEVSDV